MNAAAAPAVASASTPSHRPDAGRSAHLKRPVADFHWLQTEVSAAMLSAANVKIRQQVLKIDLANSNPHQDPLNFMPGRTPEQDFSTDKAQ